MDAIVLAGGFGTRLQSIVSDVPKPLAPIANKPFLAYLLNYLSQQGIKRVFFSLYYKAEMIQTYFGHHYAGMEIEYIVDSAPLGTGGAIVNALHQVKSRQPIFIVNGDTFVNLDYASFWEFHQKKQADFSMALFEMPNCYRYGHVEFGSEDKILAFLPKGVHQSGWINAGVYLINPQALLELNFPEVFSLESDFFQTRLNEINLCAYPTSGFFIDIGVPEDYQAAQQLLPQKIDLS